MRNSSYWWASDSPDTRLYRVLQCQILDRQLLVASAFFHSIRFPTANPNRESQYTDGIKPRCRLVKLPVSLFVRLGSLPKPLRFSQINRLLSIQPHTRLLPIASPNQNRSHSNHDCHAASFGDPRISDKSLLGCSICGSKPEPLLPLRKYKSKAKTPNHCEREINHHRGTLLSSFLLHLFFSDLFVVP
ncbi:hypothetical protein BDV37DRAFT_159150 [Aspergillus pseudonomiae]|uniref:Uncharacterized protein n=1 Tax=Aspergillus pseudonomiae TaxID=1506151 RepID=A0A5N7DR09_9EURO|nr:uncharacterized protein BDV37DRAFT_159150 [Aspergillus pseudonomiae]KAE8408826.1 hypothetical protein BDV37DRAFT_159150 [Aspergillus pseudonomiae]